MRIEESLRSEVPTFETRLFFAQLMSSYDTYAESKFGYIDGADMCLNTYKPIEELETYIEEYKVKNKPIDSYDKAFMQAIKDYIKQEQTKESVTNE